MSCEGRMKRTGLVENDEKLTEHVHMYDKAWRCYLCGHEVPKDIAEKLEAWKQMNRPTPRQHFSPSGLRNGGWSRSSHSGVSHFHLSNPHIFLMVGFEKGLEVTRVRLLKAFIPPPIPSNRKA